MSSTKQFECLLVSSVSSDPFSTLLLNPSTGTSCWSFRGTELQGGSTGVFEPLGRDVKNLFVAVENKPIIYCMALISKSGHFASRSIMPNVVKCMASHPNGNFLFASMENKIYTWMVASGDLLSIAEDSFREITVMKISACGSYLVTGLSDGSVKVYTIHSLIAKRQFQIEPVQAYRTFCTHSLTVTDLHITGDNLPRILSTSSDHTLVVSSLSIEQPLLKISADQSITSCCMDPAESRIVFGVKSGRVCIIDLLSHIPQSDAEVIRVDERTNGENNEGSLQIFEHHSQEICKVCVNFDATLLASADVGGTYCIWDFLNGQCLKTSSMKNRISALKFTEYWPQLDADQKKAQKNPAAFRQNEANISMAQLKTTFSEVSSIKDNSLTKLVQAGKKEDLEEFLYKTFEDLLLSISGKSSTSVIDNKINFDTLAFAHDDVVYESIFSSLNSGEDDRVREIPHGSAATSAETSNVHFKRKRLNENQADLSTQESLSSKQAERIRALEREVKRLQKVNQELYEKAAKLVTDMDL